MPKEKQPVAVVWVTGNGSILALLFLLATLLAAPICWKSLLSLDGWQWWSCWEALSLSQHHSSSPQIQLKTLKEGEFKWLSWVRPINAFITCFHFSKVDLKNDDDGRLMIFCLEWPLKQHKWSTTQVLSRCGAQKDFLCTWWKYVSAPRSSLIAAAARAEGRLRRLLFDDEEVSGQPSPTAKATATHSSLYKPHVHTVKQKYFQLLIMQGN